MAPVGYAGRCERCGELIVLAADGAWEDESGACGCGAGEHRPDDYELNGDSNDR